jgi:AcrR family transcriptional regulator
MSAARERILSAAAELHRERGLAGVSIRRIAEVVGVTPMAIYRHYRDKDALVDALVAAGFARWEQRLARAVDAPDPLGRVRAAMLAYVEFALDEPRTFELMFLVPRARIPHAPGSLAVTPSPSFGAVISAVHEAMAAGQLPAVDPRELMLVAWSTIQGRVALHFSGALRSRRRRVPRGGRPRRGHAPPPPHRKRRGRRSAAIG